MQAALSFTPSSIALLNTSKKPLVSPLRAIPTKHTSRCSPIKALSVANDSSTVDYSSSKSVFPAEACDTLGGDACDANTYPEVKLEPDQKSKKATTQPEAVDREYLEYNSPKTVFPGEACDDLGGEFCEPEYQSGVY